MSGISGMITGKPAKDAKKAAERARQQQQSALDAQEAVQNRQRQVEDDRELDLAKQASAQRRAINARRSRGGLAFSGPVTALKNTLGG